MATKKKATKAKKKTAPAKKAPAKKSSAKRAPAKKAHAKKTPARKVAKKAARKAAAKAPVQRRDATGHLNPQMAKDLRRRSLADKPSEGRAFLHGASSKDDLAESMGEEAVSEMTSGEDTNDDVKDEVVIEEFGGPFVKSTGRREFDRSGTDASNPKDSDREPFPKT